MPDGEGPYGSEVSMTEEQVYSKLLEQHNELLGQLLVLQNQVTWLWLAYTILVFLQIGLIMSMLFTAVWSVRSVLKSNGERMTQLERQWADHQGEIKTALSVIVRTLRGSKDDARHQPE